MDPLLKWVGAMALTLFLIGCCGSQEFTKVDTRVIEVPVPDTHIDGNAPWVEWGWQYHTPSTDVWITPVVTDTAEVARLKSQVAALLPLLNIKGTVRHDTIPVIWQDTTQTFYQLKTPLISKLGWGFLGIVFTVGLVVVFKIFKFI